MSQWLKGSDLISQSLDALRVTVPLIIYLVAMFFISFFMRKWKPMIILKTAAISFNSTVFRVYFFNKAMYQEYSSIGIYNLKNTSIKTILNHNVSFQLKYILERIIVVLRLFFVLTIEIRTICFELTTN